MLHVFSAIIAMDFHLQVEYENHAPLSTGVTRRRVTRREDHSLVRVLRFLFAALSRYS